MDLGQGMQHLTLAIAVADLQVDPGMDVQVSLYSRVRFRPVRGSTEADNERDVSELFLDPTFGDALLDGGDSSPSVSTTTWNG